MKLTEAVINEKLEVIELLTSTEYQERLHALGVVEGCEICPLRNNNSTMVVDVRGCRYALGKEITECILVKRL
jgi:Fe2+ transport system protein FeoA